MNVDIGMLVVMCVILLFMALIAFFIGKVKNDLDDLYRKLQAVHNDVTKVNNHICCEESNNEVTRKHIVRINDTVNSINNKCRRMEQVIVPVKADKVSK